MVAVDCPRGAITAAAVTFFSDVTYAATVSFRSLVTVGAAFVNDPAIPESRHAAHTDGHGAVSSESRSIQLLRAAA